LHLLEQNYEERLAGLIGIQLSEYGITLSNVIGNNIISGIDREPLNIHKFLFYSCAQFDSSSQTGQVERVYHLGLQPILQTTITVF
jgi:hypothetical protein